MTEFLDEHGDNYAAWDDKTRSMLQTLCRLLAMPDYDPTTLAALSVSYWNGKNDTFFETARLPEGFVGFPAVE